MSWINFECLCGFVLFLMQHRKCTNSTTFRIKMPITKRLTHCQFVSLRQFKRFHKNKMRNKRRIEIDKTIRNF